MIILYNYFYCQLLRLLSFFRLQTFLIGAKISLVMLVPVIIAAVTAIAMILSVLFKPYLSFGKIKVGLYVIICFLGAIAELLFGGLSAGEAIKGITVNSAVNPLKILALFLSMTLISVYLGDSGFFHLVAEKVFSSVKGKRATLRLFIILYAVVSLLTVFTSNDIVILTFTPIICIFCKKTGFNPLPFLIGEFVAANTWSITLIVGNPTNIYLAQSAGVSFYEYFKIMVLPAAAAGISALAVLLIIFRKSLLLKSTVTAETTDDFRSLPVRINKPSMAAALVALIACIAALALSDIIGAEMWIISAGFAAALFVFNLVYGIIRGEGLLRAVSGIRKSPWELVPFVLSMFVIVLALAKSGALAKLSSLLTSGEKSDGLTFGFLTAGLSNLLNNIPASVVMEKIVAGKSLAATFGAVIGTNIGAFITPVGALAGIMWNKILSGYGVKLPFYKFALYGILVAFVSLPLSLLTLFLMV